ncbi:MAG TPA: right-handed parallel beta-helix repeat-containing protein, partial [Nitriliruptorales bacterium]|nr:right-handed parallel beta-helix repeat-containing protein [Nitriliruptorales bacterium]
AGTIATTEVARTGDAGVRLENTETVTLDRVDITNAATNGVSVHDSDGLEISRVTVSGSGLAGIIGTDLLGHSAIKQTTIRASGIPEAPASHLVVRNTTATTFAPAAPTDILEIVALSAVDSVAPDPAIPQAMAADAVVVESAHGGNLRLAFAGPGVSTIDGGNHGVRGEALDGGSLDAVLSHLKRTGGDGSGIVLGARLADAGVGGASLRYALSSNDATVGGGVHAPALDGVVVTSDLVSTATGTIAGTLVDGAQTGMLVRQDGPSAPVTLIGNGISAALEGIVVELTGRTPPEQQTPVEVTGNLVRATTGDGVRVTGSGSTRFCLELDGNDSASTAADREGYVLEQRAPAAFGLLGLATGETPTGWVTRKNTGTASATGSFGNC